MDLSIFSDPEFLRWSRGFQLGGFWLGAFVFFGLFKKTRDPIWFGFGSICFALGCSSMNAMLGRTLTAEGANWENTWRPGMFHLLTNITLYGTAGWAWLRGDRS